MTENYKFQSTDYKFGLLAFLTLLIISLSAPDLHPQTVKIGAVLPLFEDSEDDNLKELGAEILGGMTFALNEYNRSPKVKVQLITRDTKKDPALCSELTARLSQVDSVQVILGPIFSSEMAEVSATAFLDGIPIVSPTATGDDLSEIHDYTFQLNPSYKVRGKLMAHYLIKELGLKNIAVISESSYGTNFSGHFVKEAEKLKANIAINTTYSRNESSIIDIIKEIDSEIRDNDLFINIANLNLTQRQKLESSGIRNTLLDSLMTYKTDVSIYYLFGRNAKKIIDTLNIKPYRLRPETAKFIQGYFDAIYIPISNPSEIGMIVPQLFSYGLSFFIAGTGDWNHEKALKDNEVYLKNLIFESEYFLDQLDPRVTDLSEKLSNTKYRLSKNFLFGYDAMVLLLSLISEGNTTRQQIYEALKKVESYNAIKSKISLDYHRINSELNILEYKDGIKRVAAYKLEK